MNRIYYFTGTGNSMRAAKVIAEKLGNVEIVSMRCDPAEVSAADCAVIGFVFPVYHWTMLAPAVSFAERLAINSEAYIFCVAMPSFICGYACERLAGIIESKGGKVSYGNLVNSVANYALVYPPFPPRKLVVPAAERKLGKIADDIANRAERPYPKAGYMVRKRRDKVMTPYLELQKFADYPFTVGDGCISCGLCSRVCPCGNIEMKEGRPNFLHHCAQCMACVTCCPKRAIGYEIGLGDKELLRASTAKTPLARIMGLPAKRKLYRNPYITVQEQTKDRMMIGDDRN